MVSLLIALLILAVVVYVAALILDVIIPKAELPPQTKPIVLAIIGLVGLVGILGRGRFFW